MAKQRSKGTHPVPRWAFDLIAEVAADNARPKTAYSGQPVTNLELTWTMQERKWLAPTGRTVKTDKRPRAKGFSYRPVYSSKVGYQMVPRTVRRWGSRFEIERQEPVYSEWRELRITTKQESSSSGFTTLGMYGRIHVREGSDRTDVAHVILHELAHWLTQAGHDATMYRCFYRLVEKYGARYGLTAEAARRRERSYKPRASEAGFRQHFGSAS